MKPVSSLVVRSQQDYSCLYYHGSEIRKIWELGRATIACSPIDYIEVNPSIKTSSEFRTVFHSHLRVHNYEVSL